MQQSPSEANSQPTIQRIPSFMVFEESLLCLQWHSSQPQFEAVEYDTHLHILFMQDPFLKTGTV